ncbi:LysR family transcriptional regulator [Paraburkholderia sediminicola]|uniref:LysR family transcriptional regulator n=1 Tax=Paraburkholderia sediminicola TaxID=458836 RepID=UPI0038B86FF4
MCRLAHGPSYPNEADYREVDVQRCALNVLRGDSPLTCAVCGLFRTMVEMGRFSKAAQELQLTQPTISKHINSTEGRLNARLPRGYVPDV